MSFKFCSKFMEIKPKFIAASLFTLKALRKINTSVGSALSSGLAVLEEKGDAKPASKKAKNSALRNKEPSFAQSVLGFARTMYMKQPRILHEDDIIDAHEKWDANFKQFLESRAMSQTSPIASTFNEPCEVCDWISKGGRVRWGKSPVLATLAQRHQYFHEQAELVLTHMQAGDHVKAQRILDSGYKYGSNQTVLVLKNLKVIQKRQAGI